MKINRQGIRRGGIWLGLTALVIALVILLNVGASILVSRKLVYGDLTSEGLYTLTEPTISLLDQIFTQVKERRAETGEDPARVKIIFCNDPDILEANAASRYVYYTARALAKQFPEQITVSTVNVWTNPSAVDDYRTNSYSSIYQSHVIIASGTEFRIHAIRSFFTFDSSTADEPWAYNGEKQFVSAILAVTRAESPICAITVNHGEPFATDAGRNEYSMFLNTLRGAGYEIQYLDLEHEEIPENCRLILTFDPQTDFTSGGYLTDGNSELAKLDAFLEATYSYMVFADADTPYLPNLEEFLEDWGVAFARYRDPNDSTEALGNYQVVAESASIDAEGLSILASYATEGMAISITSGMRESGAAPKVVFGNVMPINYSGSFELVYQMADADAGNGAYTYGHYYRNNHSRAIYDIFYAPDVNDCYARVQKDGVPLTDTEGAQITDSAGGYRLMTITRETRTVGEGKGYTTVNEASYLCAFGSTDFADNRLLDGNSYGNIDVLLQTMRLIGREISPVGLTFKPFHESKIGETVTASSTVEVTEYYNAKIYTEWTVVLTLLPGLTFLVLGTVVLVRRKFRH